MFNLNLNLTTSTNYSGLTQAGVIWALNHIMTGTDRVIRNAELNTLRSTLVQESASVKSIALVDADMRASAQFPHVVGGTLESGVYDRTSY